jgi:hypothetical protein
MGKYMGSSSNTWVSFGRFASVSMLSAPLYRLRASWVPSAGRDADLVSRFAWWCNAKDNDPGVKTYPTGSAFRISPDDLTSAFLR